MAERGPGEAREKAKRRRWLALIAVALLVGGISGFAVASFETESAAGASIPLWLAVVLTAAWLAVMGYGVWYYETQVDELERNANYYGYAIGGGLVLLIYPAWMLLWWAGALPEPRHEVLMGLLLGGAGAGYLWRKYR